MAHGNVATNGGVYNKPIDLLKELNFCVWERVSYTITDRRGLG